MANELNDGDGALGINLDDSECPECGREVRRRLYSYRAYCPRCDTAVGRARAFMEDRPHSWKLTGMAFLGVLNIALGALWGRPGATIGGVGLIGMALTTAYQVGWFDE